MRIGITGTPGTGKTTVAETLEREVISVKEFAKEKELGEEIDGIFEVDVDAVEQKLPEDCWIEGHLAHKVELDYCIVLRTRPDILEERLEKRGYSQEKVTENVEAEKMDLILSEAFEKCKIYEVDTTGKSVEEVVAEIREAVKNKESKYAVCDWSSFF